MAKPTLTPSQTASTVILPITGTVGNVNAADNPLPFGVYVNTTTWSSDQIAMFKTGSIDQVAYVYKKLGGDILDIEITEYNVYAAYEEAILEYSYILNVHQSKNTLSNLLGSTTGSFDSNGMITGSFNNGSVDKDLHLGLKYPIFDFAYGRRIAEGTSGEVNVGGHIRTYSASFDITTGQQDYDLQTLISGAAANTASLDFADAVGDHKVLINKVYYKTNRAMWNFYAYYGGLATVGNLADYGQYSDSSTFEMVPVWHNRLQAMAYEDAINVRTSYYAYELRDNQLRLFPTPTAGASPTKMWVEFTVPGSGDNWQESKPYKGIDGINNMNTMPMQNLPYDKINSIGKQWIRRFALALCKEMLGLVRSKFASIPIPGNDLSMNGGDLISAGKDEQNTLREELITVLDELTYGKLIEGDADFAEQSSRLQTQNPLPIFTG
jgi:hypothetical protein